MIIRFPKSNLLRLTDTVRRRLRKISEGCSRLIHISLFNYERIWSYIRGNVKTWEQSYLNCVEVMNLSSRRVIFMPALWHKAYPRWSKIAYRRCVLKHKQRRYRTFRRFVGTRVYTSSKRNRSQEEASGESCKTKWRGWNCQKQEKTVESYSDYNRTCSSA